jgi:F0F1-type ATP synthase assembly protein I
MQFGLVVAVFVAIGWWIDERLGTRPWAIVVAALLGSTGGMISIVQKVNGVTSGRARREGTRAEQDPPSSTGRTEPPPATRTRAERDQER